MTAKVSCTFVKL